MYALVAILVLAAAPKIEVPTKVDTPKLDMKLPDLPKADGLTGPAKEKQAEPMPTAGATGAPAKVVSIVNAKDFRSDANGYKPVSALSSMNADGFPSDPTKFKTCVRVKSPDRVPVVMTAAIVSPQGRELLSSRADVSFGGRDHMDVVVEWEDFRAPVAGDYKVVVKLDGNPGGETVLTVRGR